MLRGQRSSLSGEASMPDWHASVDNAKDRNERVDRIGICKGFAPREFLKSGTAFSVPDRRIIAAGPACRMIVRAHPGDNEDMQFQRSSGVLLHVSSLPSCGGIGDLGPAAHEFLAFLAAAKQHVWQVLPLCPTGYGNSPYAGSSAFAGNPFLISLEAPRRLGLDRRRTHRRGQAGRSGAVDFEEVERRKLPLLYEAAGNFLDRGPTARRPKPQLAVQWEQFEEFCRAEAGWLTDYALYAVLRRQFNTGAWTVWPSRAPPRAARPWPRSPLPTARRSPRSRSCNSPSRSSGTTSARLPRKMESASWATWPSSSTWIRPTSGFIPSSSNSTRICSRSASPACRPTTSPPPASAGATRSIAGTCSPSNGFDWWIDRIRRACQLYDIVRLDHFRGFEAYWAIPAAEETAVNGEWVKAPGLELFRALEGRWALAAGGRRPRPHHSRGRRAAPRAWTCRA